MPYIQRYGFNGRLAFAIAAAALGSSFQHGYNTGVVNAPQELIEDWIREVVSSRRDGAVVDQGLVTMIWAIAVSIFCVGGMLGGCITGFIADKFGRKGGLLLNNALVFVAAILMGSAKAANSYEMIILGRFFIGVNSGLNAGLAPMYLAEISPVHLRGAVGTVYQLVITISILLSQILGLESVLGTAGKWPALLAITAVPAVFQLATLPVCPESPKYILLGRGKELEAQRALTWLRGTIEVHDEMEEMRAEYDASKLVPKVTMREMFMNTTLRAPLMIAMVIMIAQQLSGINAVMFFSTKIFKMAQLSDEHAQYATLGMGTMNVLMTVISLVLVEKAGRKTLLLVGFTGMFFDTILLAICLNYAASALWVSYLSILLVIVFVQALQGNVFFVFAILLAVFVIFVYKKVPETKNKTMEEISSMFRQQSYQ
ncbi:hypothetical protein B566_EDAN007827 [Ephemera danica]|nr:hypothetical protein B566_EDAN007827 [Ephemera danica]